MGFLSRIITLVILLLSIYGRAEGNAKGTNDKGNFFEGVGKDVDKELSKEDAAELEEVNNIASIRFNSGKGPFANMEEYMVKLAKEWAKKANPGAEIEDEKSDEFLLAHEQVKIFIATATGPNYASLFTRPGTAAKYKDMFDKYDHIREYKTEL